MKIKTRPVPESPVILLPRDLISRIIDLGVLSEVHEELEFYLELEIQNELLEIILTKD